MRPGDLFHWSAGLGLPQHAGDLLFAEFGFAHPSSRAEYSHYGWISSRGAGQRGFSYRLREIHSNLECIRGALIRAG